MDKQVHLIYFKGINQVMIDYEPCLYWKRY